MKGVTLFVIIALLAANAVEANFMMAGYSYFLDSQTKNCNGIADVMYLYRNHSCPAELPMHNHYLAVYYTKKDGHQNSYFEICDAPWCFQPQPEKAACANHLIKNDGCVLCGDEKCHLQNYFISSSPSVPQPGLFIYEFEGCQEDPLWFISDFTNQCNAVFGTDRFPYSYTLNFNKDQGVFAFTGACDASCTNCPLQVRGDINRCINVGDNSFFMAVDQIKTEQPKGENKKRPLDLNEDDNDGNDEIANNDQEVEDNEGRCCTTDAVLDNSTQEQKPRIKTPPNPNSKRQQKKRRNEIKQKKKMYGLCKFVASGDVCPFPECKSNHDIQLFQQHADPPIGDYCYVFDIRGKCPFGWNCRFLPAHLKDNKLVVNEEKFARYKPEPEINTLKNDLQKKLRTKKYKFVKSTPLIDAYQKERTKRKQTQDINDAKHKAKESNNNNEQPAQNGNDSQPTEEKEDVLQSEEATFLDTDVPLKPSEKKKLDVKGKLYLAPLTTIGNLPYRRICKEFGIDITCGEMALAPNLLQGQNSEWALLKRHPSEDFFGVQICGPHVDLLTRCAEVLDENLNVDFIDINMGCPIDLIVNQGAGSALLDSHRKIQDIVLNVNRVMTKPLTIKVRVGKDETQPTVHKIFPKLENWGVSAITIHGRSRMQRYSREANWDYIKQCASLTNLPVIGNGDVYSFEDYENHVNNHGVATVMLARGAIVKPWLPTEIKEKKHWDISAQERLDIVRKYCYYGLDHWGSDTQGVENTRRFFLEWQSFLHRYIPVGLAEVMPPKIKGQKPSTIAYRSDLEALLGSPDVKDWIKLSEMFLGPVPEGFTFTPKHKANANG